MSNMCGATVFHPTVIESFEMLGDFNAAWEEHRQLVIDPWRPADKNGSYSVLVKRWRETRISNGYGGCSVVCKDLDSEPLITATVTEMCDRYYEPAGKVNRASQVKRFPADERPDDPDYKPKTALLQADINRDLSRLRHASKERHLPPGVDMTTMCWPVKRSFTGKGWPKGLRDCDRVTPAALAKAMKAGPPPPKTLTAEDEQFLAEREAFFAANRATGRRARDEEEPAEGQPRKRRKGGGQRTTGAAVTGIMKTEYGAGGEKAKAKSAKVVEEAKVVAAAKAKKLAEKKAKAEEAAKTYGKRVAGGPDALSKPELEKALKARKLSHTVSASDRHGSDKAPKQVLVERLQASISSGGSCLRVNLCEDCEVIEATHGLANRSAAEPAPRWCWGCAGTAGRDAEWM